MAHLNPPHLRHLRGLPNPSLRHKGQIAWYIMQRLESGEI